MSSGESGRFLSCICCVFLDVAGNRDGRHGHAGGSVSSNFIMAGVRF